MPNNGSRRSINKDDDDNGESIAMDQTSTNISDAPIVGNMADSSSVAQDDTALDDIDTTNDDDEQQLAAEDDNASSQQQQPNTPTARPPSITTDYDNQQPDVTSTWSADSDGRPISIPHSWRGPSAVVGGAAAHDNSIISPGGTHVISHPQSQPSSSSQYHDRGMPISSSRRRGSGSGVHQHSHNIPTGQSQYSRGPPPPSSSGAPPHHMNYHHQDPQYVYPVAHHHQYDQQGPYPPSSHAPPPGPPYQQYGGYQSRPPSGFPRSHHYQQGYPATHHHSGAPPQYMMEHRQDYPHDSRSSIGQYYQQPPPHGPPPQDRGYSHHHEPPPVAHNHDEEELQYHQSSVPDSQQQQQEASTSKEKSTTTTTEPKKKFTELSKAKILHQGKASKPTPIYQPRRDRAPISSQLVPNQQRTSQQKGCTCRKTKCLKLYCHCFANSVVCSTQVCFCEGCKNTPEELEKGKDGDIAQARRSVLIRNPNAFKDKFLDASVGIVVRGPGGSSGSAADPAPVVGGMGGVPTVGSFGQYHHRPPTAMSTSSVASINSSGRTSRNSGFTGYPGGQAPQEMLPHTPPGAPNACGYQFRRIPSSEAVVKDDDDDEAETETASQQEEDADDECETQDNLGGSSSMSTATTDKPSFESTQAEERDDQQPRSTPNLEHGPSWEVDRRQRGSFDQQGYGGHQQQHPEYHHQAGPPVHQPYRGAPPPPQFTRGHPMPGGNMAMDQQGSAKVHRVGCKCKKSKCLKKYCECFAANMKCGKQCKCEDCGNQPDGDSRPSSRMGGPIMDGRSSVIPSGRMSRHELDRMMQGSREFFAPPPHFAPPPPTYGMYYQQPQYVEMPHSDQSLHLVSSIEEDKSFKSHGSHYTASTMNDDAQSAKGGAPPSVSAASDSGTANEKKMDLLASVASEVYADAREASAKKRKSSDVSDHHQAATKPRSESIPPHKKYMAEQHQEQQRRMYDHRHRQAVVSHSGGYPYERYRHHHPYEDQKGDPHQMYHHPPPQQYHHQQHWQAGPPTGHAYPKPIRPQFSRHQPRPPLQSQLTSHTKKEPEDIVKKLPKGLTYRKVCSHCGRQRAEHGEFGFGNKCSFTTCGRCGADEECHKKEGCPMGVMCTLTNNVKPGAIQQYEATLADLGARAEIRADMNEARAAGLVVAQPL